MKILYIDQIGGISGDMILSALYDIIGEEGEKFISLLPLKERIKNSIKFKDVVKKHIKAKKFFVLEESNEIKYFELVSIIKKSKFSNNVKEKVLDTIDLIAKIESKIHNTSLKNFHFHNYNDLIVELFGTYYILEKLSVEKIFSSTIKLNHGFVECVHGKFPVPAPATLELAKTMPVEYMNHIKPIVNKNVNISINTEGIETTTPTGVAILKILLPEFLFPKMKILKIGYSAGRYDFEFPNVLRLLLGEFLDNKVSFFDKKNDFCHIEKNYQQDTVIKIETNIDDLNPVFYELLLEKLYEIGCYEVNLIFTMNKKSRSGMLINILLKKDLVDKVIRILFENTTTTGLRIEEVHRIKLFRENKVVKTKFGKINTKIVTLPNGEKEIRPEYDDIKKLSHKTGIPISELHFKLFSELNKHK
ncbi:MAG: nickel pincer cofactor biosynthesis protein LarC [Endomicrobiia bacterium]